MSEEFVKENTEIVEVNKADLANVSAMDMLMNPNEQFFCSIPDDGKRATKIKIYNAINSAETSLTDMIGKPLDVVDVVAHPISLTDEETGEIIDTVRIVLITKDGKAYHGVSNGILNSLQKIFSIVGMPSWADDPVKMEVRQVKTRNGNNKVNTIVLL